MGGSEDDIENEVTEMQKPFKFRPSFSLISGVVSGSLASLVTTPLDVIRTRLQASRDIDTRKSFLRGLQMISRDVYKEAGLRGFYRGLSPTIITLAPNWGIFFYGYDRIRSIVSPYTGYNSTLTNVIGSVMAGGITSIIVNPLWLARTKLMTNKERIGTQSTYGVIKELVAKEGAKGLFKGTGASLLGLVHIGIHLPLFEYLRSLSNKHEIHPQNKIDDVVLIQSTILAKIVSSLISYPHEVLRTRIYVSDSPVSKTQRWSVVSEAQSIFRTDGIGGFYRGLGVSLLRAIPATVIVFYTREHIIHLLNERYPV